VVIVLNIGLGCGNVEKWAYLWKSPGILGHIADIWSRGLDVRRVRYYYGYSMRDQQRSRVYRAERAAWDCADPEAPLSLSECQGLVAKVSGFLGNRGNRMIPLVTDGRGRRSACATVTRIKLPVFARTRWQVLHECAHSFNTARDHHGPYFASLYIRLVRRFIGPTEADILKIAFKEFRVKYRSGGLL